MISAAIAVTKILPIICPSICAKEPKAIHKKITLSITEPTEPDAKIANGLLLSLTFE